MKKFIIMVGAGLLLAVSGAAAKPAIEISMTDAGPAIGKDTLGSEAEKTAEGFLVRTKKLKSGGVSLLVKAENEGGEISVFGRKVKLKKNGQYQVKWDTESGKVVTAELDAEVTKWVAPPNLYPWFSGGNSADKTDGNPGAENKKNQDDKAGEKSKDGKDGEVIRLPRKIVFAPGEGPSDSSEGLMGGGAGVSDMGAGIEDETLDLPPLRDIREKLSSVGRDFSRNPRPVDVEGRNYYPDRIGGTSPRNGADMAITPISRDGTASSEADDQYVIQPGDTIDLHFYRVQRVTVDMRGDIRVVSSVGSANSTVRAAGKTPREVSESVLHSGLNFQSIPEPALKVNISRFSDRAVVVVGRVNKPGKIPLEEGEMVGINGILKKAGGVAGGSHGAIVYVKRGDKVTKADLGSGDDEALSLFRIMPGDIVTVNKK